MVEYLGGLKVIFKYVGGDVIEDYDVIYSFVFVYEILLESKCKGNVKI